MLLPRKPGGRERRKSPRADSAASSVASATPAPARPRRGSKRPAVPVPPPEPQDFYYSARDGLRLFAKLYPATDPQNAGRPALCLPGLTRNGRDFEQLALSLSRRGSRSRDVWCLDFRGRGRSARDRDWRNYTPFVELMDTLDMMTVTGLRRAAIVGTSRGGIVAMLMASLRPTALGALVLNDIGPVIDSRGLARISGYAGRTPLPSSWSDAGALMREMNGPFFPLLTDADWEDVARQWFGERNGRPQPGYDPQLAQALSGYNVSRPVPALWPQFTAASVVPALALRGANSDILSEATLEEMVKRHPRLTAVTVPNQGHAPLLGDAETLEAIGAFLEGADTTRH